MRNLLVSYENILKTVGGSIVERNYLFSKKMSITYENKSVAEPVIKFGEIEIGNRKYQASFSRISVNDLSFFDIKEILASKNEEFNENEKLNEILSK